MARHYLAVAVLTLLMAVCDAARRKPEQLACAADTYARAVTQFKNLARHGRGQPPVTCLRGSLAWLP